MAVVYFLAMFTVLIGFCSLAVDFGRVQLDKEQLQCVADAAARAALFNLSTSVAAAQAAAVNVAAANTVDGASVVINLSTDVVFGTWNPVAQTFTALSGAARSSANAVQVTCRRTAANGNAVPLLLGSMIGRAACNASSVGMACTATNIGLVNTGFESPALGWGNYTYDCPMSGWTLTGAACLEAYGSAWNGPQPNGNQAVALQGHVGMVAASMSQSFVAVEGTYNVSFLAAERMPSENGGVGGVQPINVSVDGAVIATVRSSSSTFATTVTPNFTLTTGTHTLTMAATDTTTDMTTFVDAVAINVVAGRVLLAN